MPGCRKPEYRNIGIRNNEIKKKTIMKKVLTVFSVVALLFVATPSQAQTEFGLKGGYNISHVSLSSDLLSSSNKYGFFVGPTVKFTLPIIGLGVDAAVLYDQRDAKLEYQNTTETIKQKSINIPINARYQIGLGDLAAIYLAAGPQFGINVGDDNFKFTDTTNYELKKTNFSLNVGAGVMLVSHLQIGFNYNIALGKTGELSLKNAYDSYETKNNAWQISAAYYF